MQVKCSVAAHLDAFTRKTSGIQPHKLLSRLVYNQLFRVTVTLFMKRCSGRLEKMSKTLSLAQCHILKVNVVVSFLPVRKDVVCLCLHEGLKTGDNMLD